MSLKDDLIKLGERQPDLRDDIRPVLQHVVRESRGRYPRESSRRSVKAGVPRQVEKAVEETARALRQIDTSRTDFERASMDVSINYVRKMSVSEQCAYLQKSENSDIGVDSVYSSSPQTFERIIDLLAERAFQQDMMDAFEARGLV